MQVNPGELGLAALPLALVQKNLVLYVNRAERLMTEDPPSLV